MCRHLAYLGSPATLRELLIEPPHGLYRQSWAPRRQRYGTVNADGFGAGWYAEGDPAPARYRREGPIWADRSFADLARVTRSTAVLAAVRSATEGTAAGAEAAAPYGSGRWLFSLNGAVTGWPCSVADLAGRRLRPEDLLRLEARCDAALVWALVMNRLADGADPADALADVVADISECTPARLNLLLTDGEMIAATTWGDVLGYRFGPDGVLVASEPPDDGPGWNDLPDRTVLRATRDGLELRSLDDAAEAAAAGAPNAPVKASAAAIPNGAGPAEPVRRPDGARTGSPSKSDPPGDPGRFGPAPPAADPPGARPGGPRTPRRPR
jgi:gamma-glutamyl hercynylcysteine S-oxide hydrolase